VPLAAPGVWWQGVKWMLNSESPFYIKPRASLELARWLWRFRAACTPGCVRRAMPLLRRLSMESLELYREFAERDLDFGFRQSGSLTQAAAASARSFTLANGGNPPAGYFVVGNGPHIGPKQ